MSGCYHCRRMADYYAIRERWETAAEDASYGYQTEREEFERSHPRPTFKQFLIDTKSGQRPRRVPIALKEAS